MKNVKKRNSLIYISLGKFKTQGYEKSKQKINFK